MPEPGALPTVNGWERDCTSMGLCLSRCLQIFTASFPEHFTPACVAELKCDHFYGGLPKWLKAMAAYLTASTKEKMYSDYLWVMWKAEMEEAMEPFHNQTMASTSKPKEMDLFPLQKLEGSQLTATPSAQVAHLEEESANKGECIDSEDYCSSLDHFIHDCPLVVAARTDSHLNQKQGTVPKKEAQVPQTKVTPPKVPQDGTPKV